jgi:hypothetical protein
MAPLIGQTPGIDLVLKVFKPKFGIFSSTSSGIFSNLKLFYLKEGSFMSKDNVETSFVSEACP